MSNYAHAMFQPVQEANSGQCNQIYWYPINGLIDCDTGLIIKLLTNDATIQCFISIMTWDQSNPLL